MRLRPRKRVRRKVKPGHACHAAVLRFRAGSEETFVSGVASFIVQPSGGGISISELLSGIEARIQVHDLILKLRTVVADTLGRDMQSALSWSFDLQRATSSMRIFDVSTIPAIRGPLPAGVSGVRFLVDLAGCRQLSRARIDALVSAERALLPP
ncbi:hypothetical protein SAMN05877809_106217 [Rhodobacter sp. JA431]|nr:hypothetical protein SAMN05877809_106217 [Rhodobacter sp. JA431]